MGLAERVKDLYVGDEGVMYRESEVVEGKPPDGAIVVEGIVNNFAYHPQRLEAARPKVAQLIREIVSDEFLKSKGGGFSFMSLCEDRSGEQWGEHPDMETFMCLAIGLKLAGYCVPKMLWPALPGGMPYVWFDDSQGREWSDARRLELDKKLYQHFSAHGSGTVQEIAAAVSATSDEIQKMFGCLPSGRPGSSNLCSFSLYFSESAPGEYRFNSVPFTAR